MHTRRLADGAKVLLALRIVYRIIGAGHLLHIACHRHDKSFLLNDTEKKAEMLKTAFV